MARRPRIQKQCIFISGVDRGDSPPVTTASERLVANAISDFPEFEFVSLIEFQESDGPYDVAFEVIASADLVIVDMTGLDPNALYAVGIRQGIARPIIYIAAENSGLPFALDGLIEYPMTDPGAAHNSLSSALEKTILAMELDDAPAKRITRKDLGGRVETIATAIAELRINSLSEYVDELREISVQLNTEMAPPKDDIADITRQVTSILAQIEQVASSSKMVKLILSGALAAMVAGGGAPAATIFGISIAVWEGPGAVKAALEKFLPTKKPRAPRRRSHKSS